MRTLCGFAEILELYSFNFLKKRLLIVIPRLTRNPVTSSSDALRYLMPLDAGSSPA